MDPDQEFSDLLKSLLAERYRPVRREVAPEVDDSELARARRRRVLETEWPNERHTRGPRATGTV